VSKLRGKLEAAMPDRRFIHTHPGFGYRFQPQPSSDGLPARAVPPRPTATQSVVDAPGAAPALSRDVHIGAGAD
jgi:DNA-binding winged helix-turn-helix (wHTH) protein